MRFPKKDSEEKRRSAAGRTYECIDDSEKHQNATEFFSCPVDERQARATLRAGLGKIPIRLSERSSQGFTAIVASKYASKLNVGRQWELQTHDERFVVRGEWLFNNPDGDLQVGLRILQDITPATQIGGGFFATLFGGGQVRSIDSRNPELVFLGIIMII
ncbi:MAG: hypothetical protein AAFP69_22670, partial [Planctomycetota bacterium]